MKRMMIIMVMAVMMIFMATPAVAGPMEWIGGWFGPIGKALAWVADVTGAEQAAVDWSITGLFTLIFGWILKKYNVEQWGLAWHRFAWHGGRWVSGTAKNVKYIGGFWNNLIEPFLIKILSTIPHLILQLVNGFIAGLLSDNEKPNTENKPDK